MPTVLFSTLELIYGKRVMRLRFDEFGSRLTSQRQCITLVRFGPGNNGTVSNPSKIFQSRFFSCGVGLFE